MKLILSFLLSLAFVSSFAEEVELPKSVIDAYNKHQKGVEAAQKSFARTMERHDAALQRSLQRALDAANRDKEPNPDLIKNLASKLQELETRNVLTDPSMDIGAAEVDLLGGRIMKVDGKTGLNLGKLPKGALISIQYIEGTWASRNHPNDMDLESPDSTKNFSKLLCIASKESPISVIKGNTNKEPFHVELMQDYEQVLLRPNSYFGNGWGVVTYRIRIVKP